MSAQVRGAARAFVLVSLVALVVGGCAGSPPPSPAEARRWRTWARFLEVTALARVAAATPPWLRPDPGVHAGLDPEVARVLRRLNDQPKDVLWVVEHDPVDVVIDGAWVELRDSGEGSAWVGRQRGELRRLGVEVAWNEQLLVYEAR